MEPCVSGVPAYVTTTSLMVYHTNTVALDRVRTVNGPTVLVPSPGITRGRRCRGTVTLIGTNTTSVVRRGSLANTTLVHGASGVLLGPRGLRGCDRGSHGVTVASSGREVCSMIGGILKLIWQWRLWHFLVR